MTRATKRRDGVQLTDHQLADIERGWAISWRVGIARASLARDPGDGRYLWAVTWSRVGPRYDESTDTWSAMLPGGIRQGKSERLADALDSIAIAHGNGRP